MSKEEILKEMKDRWANEVTGDWELEFDDLLSQALDLIEAETRKQTAEEILNSMIEEYDLSDKESPNGWMDVIPCELRAFIYELKSKYGIQETEETK